MADNFKFKIDLDSNPLNEGSKAINGFNRSSAALASLLRGDFLSAAHQAGGAIRNLVSGFKSFPVAGTVGLIAGAIIAATKAWESFASKALEQTKAINAAWVNTRNIIRDVFSQTPQDLAKGMAASGDKYGLGKAAEAASDRFQKADEDRQTAQNAFNNAMSQGNKKDALNVYLPQWQRAAEALKKAKTEYLIYYEALQELRAAEAKGKEESRSRAGEQLGIDKADIEVMKATKEGEPALESLYRKRAANARLDMIPFMGTNRTVEAQAEAARLEKVALQYEAMADAIKEAREEKEKLSKESAKEATLRAEAEQKAARQEQAAKRRELVEDTFDAVSDRASPKQALELTQGRIADLQKELKGAKSNEDRDRILGQIQDKKLKEFDLKKQISSDSKVHHTTDYFAQLRIAAGEGTLAKSSAPTLSTTRLATQFRSHLGSSFSERLLPSAFEGGPEHGPRRPIAFTKEQQALNDIKALLQDQNNILKDRLGIAP